MKVVVKDPIQLRMILIQKGFSQRNFSKSVGMSENYFNQIINNKKNPSPIVAKRIAEQLELTFEDLFIIQ
ncbi:helix-turn-helix transcriptional regulator [Bacillus sp. ISL-41]|uniref:helix-turn-helix transcriptional regulator n=1 Tax=Bacillus sp. ISL-41 TaxID=2819127 RepID=UPI001BE5E253|nr:helix-turn-helix transcriptional regulator [Bacillus sp. ISL-41]MBT2641727.1 helix-turn-helix transcriptional regulator [Bacillus sp. ISL-41]